MRKSHLGILFFLILFFFFGGYAYLRHFEKEIKGDQYKLLSSVATYKLNEIETWFSEKKSEGVFFAGDPGFITQIKQLSEDPDNNGAIREIKKWLNPAIHNNEYKAVRVFTPSGRLLLTMPENLLPEPGNVEIGWIDTISGTDIVFSDLKKSVSENHFFLYMAVPVSGQDGNGPVGFLAFTIDPEYFLFPLIRNYPIYRQSAMNILSQPQGDSILFFQGGGGGRSSVRTVTLSVDKGTLIKSVSPAGTLAMVEARDCHGRDVIADIRVIPGTRWTLVSRIDLDEISIPIRERAIKLILYLMMFLAVVVFAMILIWKNQKLHIFRSQLEMQMQTSKAEEKITFMNALLEQVNDAIITFDKDMMILEWNKGAEKIYGWKAEEVVGKFGGGSLRVDLSGPQKAEATRELEQTGAWKGEVVHKRKDGSTVYLLSSTSQLRDSNGNLLGIIAINKDVTEVVQSGKVKNAVYRISELAHSAPDLHEMYMSIHIVIGELMDARNIYIALLEPDGKMLSFPYFVDEKDTPPAPCKLGNGLTEYVLKTGKPLLARPEDTQYFIDREIIDVVGTPAIDWLGIPLKNEKETFGVLVIQSYSPQIRYGEHEKDILTFVSEQIALSIQRRKIQVELVEARQKAEVSSKLTTALLANMNHELRTPMNGILGFAEILMNELSNPELKGKAENILISGRRLMDTLDAIMDLSYLESENLSHKFRPVPVELVINAVARNYYRAMDQKKLAYKQSVPTNLTVFGDEQLFHHLIRIVLDNAVKYTDKGSIHISAEMVQAGEEEMISISVKDTGIGISNENHRMIFDPFRQVSEGYGRQFEGSGLGLAIARKIVDLMKGNIKLKSAIGVGSEFTIELPAGLSSHDPVNAPAADNAKVPRHQPRNKKLPDVLIVEDNMVNIQLLMIYIRKYCNIFTTVDARSAIQLAQQQQFDAVLMDINLGPGMDGIQAMLEIRRLQGYHDIPIIAVTGYASIGDRERLIQIGFSGYIPKPFDRETISMVMNGLFPKS